MRKFVQATVAAVALLTAASNAEAATLIVDISGQQTFDAFQDTSNTVFTFNIGAGARVTGLTYDITLTTIGGSYLSEASLYYTDSPVTDGVVFRPGIADARSGTATYTGTSDLIALGLDFVVGANGLLRLELAESFDDNPNAADATFTRGLLTFNYEPAAAGAVPEPATWGTMILGFGIAGAALRRRRSAIAATA